MKQVVGALLVLLSCSMVGAIDPQEAVKVAQDESELVGCTQTGFTSLNTPLPEVKAKAWAKSADFVYRGETNSPLNPKKMKLRYIFFQCRHVKVAISPEDVKGCEHVKSLLLTPAKYNFPGPDQTWERPTVGDLIHRAWSTGANRVFVVHVDENSASGEAYLCPEKEEPQSEQESVGGE